jgi:hypothetical protein
MPVKTYPQLEAFQKRAADIKQSAKRETAESGEVAAVFDLVETLPFKEAWPVMQQLMSAEPAIMSDARAVAWMKANAKKAAALANCKCPTCGSHIRMALAAELLEDEA